MTRSLARLLLRLWPGLREEARLMISPPGAVHYQLVVFHEGNVIGAVPLSDLTGQRDTTIIISASPATVA